MGGRRSSSRMSAAKGLATLALSAILYVTGCSAFLVTAPSAVRGWRSAPGKVDGGICGKLELPGAVAVKHVQGSTLTRVRTDKGRLRCSGGGIVSTRASAVEAWSFTGAEPPGVFRAGNGMAVRSLALDPMLVQGQAACIRSLTRLTADSFQYDREQGDEVLTIRHDKIGTCLELWHGSYGWFDYAPSDGASLVLCDNWAVTQPRINKASASQWLSGVTITWLRTGTGLARRRV